MDLEIDADERVDLNLSKEILYTIKIVNMIGIKSMLIIILTEN